MSHASVLLLPPLVEVQSPSPAKLSPRWLECQWDQVARQDLVVLRDHLEWMQRIHDNICNRYKDIGAVHPSGTWTLLRAAQILFLWMCCRVSASRALAGRGYFMLRNLWICIDSRENRWGSKSMGGICNADRQTLVDCQLEILRQTQWTIYTDPPFLTRSFLHELRFYVVCDSHVKSALPGYVTASSRYVRLLVYDYLWDRSETESQCMFFAVWAQSALSVPHFKVEDAGSEDVRRPNEGNSETFQGSPS